MYNSLERFARTKCRVGIIWGNLTLSSRGTLVVLVREEAPNEESCNSFSIFSIRVVLA